MKFELPLGRDAEERYGAPYLQMHRGDLHEALLSALPAAVVIRGKQLVETAAVAGGVRLSFADGHCQGGRSSDRRRRPAFPGP
jgi:6-hydroxynicotinate 3-monooxygenase